MQLSSQIGQYYDRLTEFLQEKIDVYEVERCLIKEL